MIGIEYDSLLNVMIVVSSDISCHNIGVYQFTMNIPNNSKSTIKTKSCFQISSTTYPEPEQLKNTLLSEFIVTVTDERHITTAG